MNKITKRDAFAEAIKVLNGEVATLDTEAVVAVLEKEIENLANRAERTRKKNAEKKANDPLMDVVRGALTDELQTLAELTEAIGDENVTVSKVSARLTKLFKAGEVVKESVKIPATEETKARQVMAYKLADVELVDAE